ncbi:hypothetical protein AB1M95_00915 [Sulfitobacter sp. LCG007]
MISGILVASALLRTANGVGEAFATEHAAADTAEPEEVVAGVAGAIPADREALSPLLEAFMEREARIREQEKQIEMRQKALSVADDEIERRLETLRQTEEALRQTIAIANTAAEDDLGRLTSVYEAMKPKDAAALFEAMDPVFAAGFLGRMKPEAAAGIMTGLSPQAAYSISAILAGRNANAPKN